MLIDFTVSNFRSIKEPQTLSMLATSIKEHPENVMDTPDPDIKLLKTAVIYGANGSGKSNILKAMEAFRLFVFQGNDLKLGQKIKDYYPFKLHKNNLILPTDFSIEFFAPDGIRYKYSISYNNSEILKEELYYYPKKQEAKLFIRNKGKEIDFGDSLRGAKKNIESQLLPNQLFLSKAANNNHEQLGLIYNSVSFITILVDSSLFELFGFANGGPKLDMLNRLLSYGDVGVQNISVDYAQFDKNKPPFDIKTYHNQIDNQNKINLIDFDLSEESEGTQKLYHLGTMILTFLEKNNNITIDELNNSFHPLMTEMLIKMFYNKGTNPNNSQLIFTTHDTSFLNSGLFRRDQIWFTEKDQYGATQLYSLSEFDKDKVRPDIPFDKWYLSGRFGALPLIKDFNFNTDAPNKKGK